MVKIVVKVEVVPYNEDWPRKYALEANVIRNIVLDELITITHVGSTAVPGLVAKPIIDILIIVEDINELDQLDPLFKKEDYECCGEDGISGRRFYYKSDGSIHVHAFDERSHDKIELLISFYDYLKDNPDIAREYGELKLSLAKKYPDNIKKYKKGKEAFTKEIQTRALKWYRHKDVEQI